MKWIKSQTYHINIKPLIVRLWYIPQRIKSTFPADQNLLKFLLCSNTSNSKWILVKLTSHLWQVALQIPQWRNCHDHFWRNLLSNSPARDLVVTLMITSDNFLGNNLFPTESPQSSLTYNLSWDSYFLAPQRVFGRLSSKSIISKSIISPMDFLGCHVNNTPLTISYKTILRRYQFSTQFMMKTLIPPSGIISFAVMSSLSPLNGKNSELGGFSIG